MGRKSKSIIEIGGIPHQECCKCKKQLPVTNFGKCSSAPNGINWACKTCLRPITAKATRQRHQVIRRQVLSHYSNGTMTCACCGEGSIEFLAIDHINGGGNQHRREIGGHRAFQILAWLVKNKYPEGFRVLCHNCNLAKGFYGYCPHEKEFKTFTA